MELRNTFTVPGRPDEVFTTLLDLEQVASCMPGAALEERDGDEYRGTLRLRVGPIAAAYRGTVVVVDADPRQRTARLQASGKELTGQGGAEATVHASVEEDGDGSRVSVRTDVQIRGKAAQFGRGVLGEVTQRVIDQFAANLEAHLLGGGEAPDGAPAPAAAGQAGDGDSLDVLTVVALPMLRRAAPVVAGFLLGLLLAWLRWGRRATPPARPQATGATAGR